MKKVALLFGVAVGCGGFDHTDIPAQSSQDNVPASPSPGAGENPSFSPASAMYSTLVFDDVGITSDPIAFLSYQRAVRGFYLPGAPFASVRMVVDLTTTCFPFSQWQNDPRPPGHRWPSRCDAFDRNFEISLLDSLHKGEPALELVHAVTPFGGPMHIELDVTDVFNQPGQDPTHTMEVFIPTYSDKNGLVTGSAGEWNVSVRLDVATGPPPRDVLAVISLHDGMLAASGGVAKVLPFTLPPGTTKARIEYAATGHGSGIDAGCIGPAEEFCRRKHTLTLDGATIATIDPWRTDCGDLCTLTQGGPAGAYCKENPCGDPLSVRAPRANWCPGSVTPPKVYEYALLPGPHVMAVTVDKIAERGNWRIGARVTAYR